MWQYMIFHCDSEANSSLPAVVAVIPVEELDEIQPVGVMLRAFKLTRAHRIQHHAFALEQSNIENTLVDKMVEQIGNNNPEVIPTISVSDPGSLLTLQEKNSEDWDIFLVVTEYDEVYVEVVLQSGWVTLQSTEYYRLDSKLDRTE